MNDGTHIFFLIQFRQTHEGPLNGPLKEVKREDWHNCYGGLWDLAIDPWTNPVKGHPSKKFPESSEDRYRIWCNTRKQGWSEIKYAVQALRRCQIANIQGRFDHESLGTKLSSARYEFRIVKMTCSQKTEEVTLFPTEKGFAYVK